MALLSFFRNVGVYISATIRKQDHVGHKDGSTSASGFGVPIFIINLERNKQRREFSLQRLADIGLTGKIVTAVDGKLLDLQELEEKSIYVDSMAHEKFSRSLSAAEIGCALSHIKIYQSMLQDKIDKAIVLEDDAMLVTGIQEKISALIKQLPDDWDVVQLIYECKDYNVLSPDIVKFRSEKCMPVAAAAYLIRQSGAKKLIDECFPIRYPADSLIGRSPRWGANVYGARARLVSINNVFPSDIFVSRTLKASASNYLKGVFVRLFR